MPLVPNGQDGGDTPYGPPPNPHGKALDATNATWVRQDAATNSIDGKRTNEENRALGFHGDMGDVATAIRELIQVIQDIKAGMAGAAAPGAPGAEPKAAEAAKPIGSAQAEQQRVRGLLEKLQDAKAMNSADALDSLEPEEAKEILDRWGDQIGAMFRKRLGEIKTGKRKPAKPWNDPDLKEEDVEAIPPEDAEPVAFVVNEQPNVADWREREDSYAFNPGAKQSFDKMAPFQERVTFNQLDSDTLGFANMYRDEEVKFRGLVIDLIRGLVASLQYDNSELEEIKRYFLQMRTTV